MNRLAQIHRQYEVIVRSEQSPDEKDIALYALLSAMKREFNIPAIQDAKWERENKAVIALYRIISQSRATL